METLSSAARRVRRERAVFFAAKLSLPLGKQSLIEAVYQRPKAVLVVGDGIQISGS